MSGFETLSVFLALAVTTLIAKVFTDAGRIRDLEEDRDWWCAHCRELHAVLEREVILQLGEERVKP